MCHNLGTTVQPKNVMASISIYCIMRCNILDVVRTMTDC